MHKRIVVAMTIATLSITACIIGPKQDDPVDIRTSQPDTSVDTGAEFVSDTGASDVDPATVPDAGGGGDAKADGDARDGDTADGDAADGDAVTDGAESG